MGGGGHVIIRSAMKTALTNPLVHGALPRPDQTRVDPILVKDVNDWTHEEECAVMRTFAWAQQHI